MKNETTPQTLIGRCISNEPQEYRIAAKAKALMKGGRFVDTKTLSRGVYPCGCPMLYPLSTTIDSLCDEAMAKDGIGDCYFGQEYFENLRSCELVEVYIVIPS